MNIYLVDGLGRSPRLVRAPNRTRAIRHVADDTIRAHVATQDELIAAVRAGIEIEAVFAQAETPADDRTVSAAGMATAGNDDEDEAA